MFDMLSVQDNIIHSKSTINDFVLYQCTIFEKNMKVKVLAPTDFVNKTLKSCNRNVFSAKSFISVKTYYKMPQGSLKLQVRKTFGLDSP